MVVICLTFRRQTAETGFDRKTMKTLFFTFGCKVNQYDTQMLREAFAAGYIPGAVAGPELAVVNTCCVTARAENDCLKLARKLLRQGKKVWITGCLVKKEGEKLRQLLPGASLYERDFLLMFLPACVLERTGPLKGISYFAGHVRAFVKVQEGCENRCSYCIVPLVRGASRSRPEAEILREIETLADNGYREIVLTGTDLGSYGKDTGTSLAGLLQRIFRGRRGLRIRLSSLELIRVSPELLSILKESESFCPHFHIPLQSGSDRVLRLMARRYTAGQYLKAVAQIKKLFPEATITTDCLVGFPGEAESDFQLTCQVVEKVGFLKVHVFPYSVRPGTAAAFFPGKVPLKVIKERKSRLLALAEAVSAQEKKSFLGTQQDLLTEKINGAVASGHTGNYLPVRFTWQAGRVNEVVRVSLTGLTRGCFEGTIAFSGSAAAAHH